MPAMWIPYDDNEETAPFIDAWQAAERLKADQGRELTMCSFYAATHTKWKLHFYKDTVRRDFSRSARPAYPPVGTYQLCFPLRPIRRQVTLTSADWDMKRDHGKWLA